jgi:hypothetical protein
MERNAVLVQFIENNPLFEDYKTTEYSATNSWMVRIKPKTRLDLDEWSKTYIQLLSIATMYNVSVIVKTFVYDRTIDVLYITFYQ